jgi:hypothetical protein
VFRSLDFVHVPTADVDETARHYVDVLGATLEWEVRGVGTVVAALRMAGAGDSPVVLLSGHPELEIPHGPCASFRAAGGQRYAVYELVRPGVDAHFTGRVEEP